MQPKVNTEAVSPSPGPPQSQDLECGGGFLAVGVLPVGGTPGQAPGLRWAVGDGAGQGGWASSTRMLNNTPLDSYCSCTSNTCS